MIKNSLRLIITVLLSVLIENASAQELHVFVTEAQTADSIPLANAVYKGRKSVYATADSRGEFTIQRIDGETLDISAVGYKVRHLKVNANTPDTVHVTLLADTRKLQEVVVKAKRRTRYVRKNNPAVELMRRVIAAKQRTDLSRHDFYQYDKYQKITMGVNNITPDELEGKLFKNSPWLLDQVEVCQFNNKLILPLSVDETVTRHLYRKEPKDEKDIVLGQTTKGISKLLQTGKAMNTVVKDLFCDIDLYDDQVDLLQKRFPSPIGSTAISFYHFYIDDTVYVNQDRCIRLQFMPANQQDFGFRGELYVLDDSTLHVKRCDMQLPANTGVNFIDAMKIEQEYTKLGNGDWALTTDNMIAELKMTDLFSRGIVIRTTKMSNYNFEPISDKLLKGKASIVYAPNAKIQNSDFWTQHRTVGLTKSENNMDSFIKRMSKSKHYKLLMFCARALIENFVETGSAETPSKVDLGPVNTLVSRNFVDGLRFRASARTTAKLNPHWFMEGYYAYGTKSHRSYYGATVTYSFNKPEYYPLEWPTRALSFESTSDVMAWSDRFLKHNKDNIFMALRPNSVHQMFFYNRQRLNFTWETNYGLGTSLSVQTESNEPTGELYFKNMAGEYVPKIRMSQVSLAIDFRPGQQFINSKQNRVEVNFDAPRFCLSHAFGLNHFLGGNYNYNHTEFSVYKRFWLGSWGHFDTRLYAGAEWNKVPFPLLIMPRVNTSYFEHQGSFNMMKDMEFLNDRYAQFNLAWDLEGKIFNRIPLIKKLKWREYVAFKGLWGHLTDKNNPTLSRNAADPTLFRFPQSTHVMGSEPYLELVFGVHNIFKMFEIDYVRRLTYTAYPGVKVNGIRFGFNLVF